MVHYIFHSPITGSEIVTMHSPISGIFIFFIPWISARIVLYSLFNKEYSLSIIFILFDLESDTKTYFWLIVHKELILLIVISLIKFLFMKLKTSILSFLHTIKSISSI